MYAGRKWAFIEEHLHDVLGKQSRDAGDLDAAVGHFAAMLPCRHSPENWQAFYLRQFLEVVQQQAAARRVRGATSCRKHRRARPRSHARTTHGPDSVSSVLRRRPTDHFCINGLNCKKYRSISKVRSRKHCKML